MCEINNDLCHIADRPGKTDCCYRTEMNGNRRAGLDRRIDAVAEHHGGLIPQDTLPGLRVVRRDIQNRLMCQNCPSNCGRYRRMTDGARVLGSLLDRAKWNADVSCDPGLEAEGMTDGPATDDFVASRVVGGKSGGIGLRLKEYETNEKGRTRNARLPADYRSVHCRQSMYRLQHWSIRSFGSKQIPVLHDRIS